MTYEGVTRGWNLSMSDVFVGLSWPSPSHQRPTRPQGEGWQQANEHYYTYGVYSVLLDAAEVLSFSCFLPDMDKNQRQCFLFYVYGWFFGLGLGVIATIYSFVEADNIATQINMSAAVFVSVVVATSLLSLNACCGNSHSKRCRNRAGTVLRVAGLVLIMMATLAGTFLSNDPGGLFFICSMFSFACYLMAWLGFTVKICREHKKSRRQNSETRDTDPQVMNAVVHSPTEWLPSISVIYEGDGDRVQIDSRNQFSFSPEFFDANGRRLPVLTLPSYLEAVAQSGDSPPSGPPAYSDAGSGPASPGLGTPNPGTYSCDLDVESPPQYEDAVRDSQRAV